MTDFGLDATTVLTLQRPLLARVQPPAAAGIPDEEDGEIDAPQPMDIDVPSHVKTAPATDAGKPAASSPLSHGLEGRSTGRDLSGVVTGTILPSRA